MVPHLPIAYLVDGTIISVRVVKVPGLVLVVGLFATESMLID